jgi:heptosyltransferase-3
MIAIDQSGDADRTLEGIDQLANVERIKGGGIDRRGINKILLIQFGDLGDVIVTFPCMRALKETFPDASLVMAVHAKAGDLARGCQWADGILVVEHPVGGMLNRLKHNLQFALNVKRQKYDLVFDLRTGDRSAILTLLTGAAQRVSFYGKYNTLWRNRIYSHLVYPDKSPELHMVDYYLSLLNAYDIDTRDRIPTYQVTEKDALQTTRLFHTHRIEPVGGLIAYHPFSLWDYKSWAEEKHARIIDWIVHRFKASVIITGTAAQHESAEAIVTRCRKDVHNLAGKTPLALLPAILQRCDVSMGVDTAGGHIAAAVGTPTITLFGPGNFFQWAPMAERGTIVHKHWDCVPCKQMGCDGNRKSRCLDELTVSEVKADIEDFMTDIFSSKRHIRKPRQTEQMI